MEKLVSELWETHMRHQDPAETLNKDIISHSVPFQEVPDLVASRRVYLSKGYAYVAMSQIVEALSNAYFGPDYSQACLLNCFVLFQLRENHHLKHGGRIFFLSEENLRAALNRMGVSGHALEEIMDKVKNRHYQLNAQNQTVENRAAT
ncbi:hypothetical protein HU200_034048 [Digitaria exilis]|uniref:Uncharacterized protein n=1 Tax=Digitaria exilis TaxID=1010633 RepID=A0A835BH88_9POAL|nr:hypothetical protein HU200_034048 [Digitaria exilis]